MSKVKASPPKPLFRVGQPVVLVRAGFPGHTKGTALVIIQVLRGGKRDGFAHRYRVRADTGPDLYVYESDVSTHIE